MEHFEYQISTIDPAYGHMALWDDMEKVFVSFEKNAAVESVDICGSGGDTVAVLIGTKQLENYEVETLLRQAFADAGRNHDQFTLTALGV